MKTIQVFLIVSTLVITGCATKAPSASVFRPHGQAPRIDFSDYETPQKRIGLQNKNIAIAAAMSGGGHRAANFGAGVLVGLERIGTSNGGNLLQEIDYFSTVSGGGFAAGSYISTLYDHLRSDNSKTKDELVREFSYERYFDHKPVKTLNADQESLDCNSECGLPADKPVCVKRNLERGYREPILAVLYTPSIWFSNLDRGDLLQRKIESRLLASCWRRNNDPLRLRDVFQPKGAVPDLPMWATNSTVYENGSIFPLTPDIAAKYKITGFTHNLTRYCMNSSRPQCTSFSDYGEIPLSVGVKASASFPGAVTATTLRSGFDSSNSFLHLIDGGVADNLGITTAIDMLNSDEAEIKALLVIDSFKESYEPFSSGEGSPKILQVLKQLFSLPLNSWRGRHQHTVDLVTKKRVRVIYLNFDIITTPIGPLSEQECPYTKEELVALAKVVETDFNLTPKQQHELFCAGLFAVETQRSELLRILDRS